MEGCVGIRADGNTILGMGHLMRCRTIALQLVKRGCRVVFFTSDDKAGELLESWGFPVRVLHSDYRNMEQELPALLEGLSKEGVRLLLVDSYQVTREYLNALGKRQPVYLMDDMGQQVFPVKGVINYNIYGAELPYEKSYGAGVRLLLGACFAPVREEFVTGTYTVRECAERIVITMGGSELYDFGGELAEMLCKQIGDVELELVCGAFSPHLERLRLLEAKEKRIHVHGNVQNMAELMEGCDLAISAAGSTMYELCAVGVPAITCYYVENQRQIAESFGRKTKVYNAGNLAEKPKEAMENILAQVKKMLSQYGLRTETSASMRGLVDGVGAGSIAEALMGICE